MSWNDAKRSATATERELEDALGRFMQVRLDKGDPSFVTPDERALEAQIERLLAQLSGALEKMGGATVDKPPTYNVQIQRLREIMYGHRSKFRTTQNKLKQLREAEALRKYMAGGGRGQGDDADKAAERMLMKEHTHIANSSQMTGEIIDQAIEINTELRRQRQQFGGASGRLGELGRMVPGVNQLIQRIQDKRTRDNTILALVIAFCMCFILWYWLSDWGV